MVWANMHCAPCVEMHEEERQKSPLKYLLLLLYMSGEEGEKTLLCIEIALCSDKEKEHFFVVP